MTLAGYREFFLKKSGEHELLCQQLKDSQSALAETSQQIEDLSAARELAMKASLVAQQQVKARFEKLATAALQWIYRDQDLSLKVELGQRGSNPTLNFLIKTGDIELDPLSSTGGGVVQVLALVLRLAVLEALHVRGPLLLDEPLSQLSRNYQERAGEFLNQYSARTGRQILLVSHSPEILTAASKVFRVRLVNGVSVVTEEEGEV